MKHSGTFMYHPHADEMVQMAMGMMGLIVVHPRDAAFMRVDRDFVVHAERLRHRSGQLHPARDDDARLQPVVLELARVPGHRSAGGAPGRPRARAHRQSHDDQPSDPHPRPRLRGDRDRRRLGAEVGALARGLRPTSRWARCARSEFVADNPGRLGLPLPQVAPHDERHGPQRADDDRRGSEGGAREDHPPRARLHGDGIGAAWRRWARWRCRSPRTRCR